MKRICPGLDIASVIGITISYIAVLVTVISANILMMRGKFKMAVFMLSLGMVVGFGVVIIYIFTSH